MSDEPAVGELLAPLAFGLGLAAAWLAALYAGARLERALIKRRLRVLHGDDQVAEVPDGSCA